MCKNIDILIDYMHQSKFLNPSGQMRSISLAEIGYTSYFGDENQEASVAYGYLKAASLPDVDALLLFLVSQGAAKARASEIIGMDIDQMISENIVWTRGGDGVVQ